MVCLCKDYPGDFTPLMHLLNFSLVLSGYDIPLIHFRTASQNTENTEIITSMCKKDSV